VDARHLPFSIAELNRIVMTAVLHHTTAVARFLQEATRCIKPGGQVLVIEPWNTPWSRWVYQRLHSEAFKTHGAEPFPTPDMCPVRTAPSDA
jgi:ubiquinone/menaquinone biosynthesis C-methylase UbiE